MLKAIAETSVKLTCLLHGARAERLAVQRGRLRGGGRRRAAGRQPAVVGGGR